MKRRSLRNGAVLLVTLGTLTGVGTMVASASTRPGADSATPGGAGSGVQTGQRGTATAGPLDPTTTPSSPDPAGTTASINACVAVRTINTQQTNTQQTNTQQTGTQQTDAQTGTQQTDAQTGTQQAAAQQTGSQTGTQQTGTQQTGDAQLCTTVQRTGLRVDQVRVTLTAPAGDCRDGVTLGVATQQGGANPTQFATCTGTDRATATFTPDQQVTTGSQVCGTLAADDQFAAAQACVRVAA